MDVGVLPITNTLFKTTPYFGTSYVVKGDISSFARVG